MPRRLRKRRRPAGTAGGGSQLYRSESARAAALYEDDKNKPIRKSHENPVVKEVYETYLGSYGSHKAHEILHTSYKKTQSLLILEALTLIKKGGTIWQYRLFICRKRNG